MRLAVVVDTFPRWSERFIARELNELRRRGVELAVFALRRGALPPGCDPEWDALRDVVRVIPAASSGPSLRRALRAVPGLRAAEARQRLWRVRQALGLGGVARTSRHHVLSVLLYEGRFDRIHAHFANWPSTLAWLAAAETGLPLTLSFHARDLFVEPQLLEEKVRAAEAVFVCHSAARARLEQIPGAKGKVRLAPHGLPLENFPFRTACPAAGAQGHPEMLAAGRFVPKKGFDDLLAALAEPALAQRAHHVTLLGEGPQRRALEAAIAARGWRNRVALRGPVCGPELHALLAGAALFVAPYRPARDGDVDGIPNVVLEAFALGVPVVGTDAGGLPEVLTERTGWAVPAGEPASLARALAACLDDPQGAAARARAARALIEERFDIRRNIAPLLEAFGAAQTGRGQSA